MDRNWHIDTLTVDEGEMRLTGNLVLNLNVHDTLTSYEGDIRLTGNLGYILSLVWLI